MDFYKSRDGTVLLVRRSQMKQNGDICADQINNTMIMADCFAEIDLEQLLYVK